LALSVAVPLPLGHAVTHALVAFAAEASGEGTATHLARQSTSSAAHALRQARSAVVAESVDATLLVVLVTEATTVVVLVLDCALAVMARMPATIRLVKRILGA